MCEAKKGSVPTFETSRGKSIIDITLSNCLASERIKNWEVDTSLSFSDHKYILFDYNNLHKEQKFYRNIKRTDWIAFQSSLWNTSDPKHDLTTREGIDAEAEALATTINSALKQTSAFLRI